MKRLWIGLTALVLAVLPFRAVLAQGTVARPENLGDNAALKYWIAFALMPEFTPGDDEIIAHWQDMPLNEKVATIMNTSENALSVLQRAAEFRRCDWGLIKDGPGTLLPHLGKARQIARLACLRARYRAGKGDGEGAVKDLLAVFTLSRHCNAEGSVISLLVRTRFEEMAIEAAAENLKRLDRDQLKKLAAGLDALPEQKTFRDAILSERDDLLGWTVDYLKRDGVKAGEEVKRWSANGRPKGKVTQETVNGLVREFEKAREYYTQWAETGTLPLAEFERQTKVIEERLKKDCPFTAADLFPAVAKIRYKDAASQARMAMLKAAIAVVLDGPDRLKDFKDPFGDGPFEYRPIGNGFQLKSKLLYDDQPVALTVAETP